MSTKNTPKKSEDEVSIHHSRTQSNESNTSNRSERPPSGSCRSQVVPPSKIVAVLKDLKDDIDNTFATPCNSIDFGCSSPVSGVTSGLSDVYIEHKGKFTKAPKELLNTCNFNTKEVYLEEMGPTYLTPLDLAIVVEKFCSTISRILLGILAGMSLLKVLFIRDFEDVLAALPHLAFLTDISSTCFSIILPICLVSIFDWFDLAHTSPQHLADSLKNRKICLVIVIYVFVMIGFLCSAPYNDFILLYNKHNDEEFSDDKITRNKVYVWRDLWTVTTVLAIIGWLIVTVTRNEDLFYIHLIEMKKFEESYDQQLTFENPVVTS